VYIHGRLSEQLSGSQAAFGKTFRVTGSHRKDRINLLKRVTGSIFLKFVTDFRAASRKCILVVLYKKTAKY
jgi:hypothetical protein